MFEFIQGTLCKKSIDHCVVQVGGIGFRIFIDARTSSSLGNVGDEITIYTYLQVKEDDLSLFGFSSQEELAMFQLLISVNGVGPKVALAVLSSMTPASFSAAVSTGDYKAITVCKGVGPKLAQRIILELKDKIKANLDLMDEQDDTISHPEMDMIQEAVAALVVLGYRSLEASKAVKNVYKDGLTLEELVKLSLINLMK